MDTILSLIGEQSADALFIMKRRTFIKQTSEMAGGLALLPFIPGRGGSSDQDYPIIDTHQHLWDLERFPLSWVKPPLSKSFLMDDYREAVENQNVVKAIYMEVAVPSEQRKEEALWALALCEDPENPTVAAVIRAHPTDSDFESYMNSFEGNPNLKGIRYFFGNEEEILLPQVIKNIRLLGEMGLSFDLNLSPEWLHHGNQLLDKCPDTRFILNHCGNADPMAFFPTEKEMPRKPKHDRDKWLKDVKMLSQRNNIVCKISGLVDNVSTYSLTAADLAPVVNHCIDVFGPDRVMFASDWPVCLVNMPLAKWIDTLKEIVSDRPSVDQRKLFHDNASNFYRLG